MYYKVGQFLFQSRLVIIKWGNFYYKKGQVLQRGAIITEEGSTIFSIETAVRNGFAWFTHLVHPKKEKFLAKKYWAKLKRLLHSSERIDHLAHLPGPP